MVLYYFVFRYKSCNGFISPPSNTEPLDARGAIKNLPFRSMKHNFYLILGKIFILYLKNKIAKLKSYLSNMSSVGLSLMSCIILM